VNPPGEWNANVNELIPGDMLMRLYRLTTFAVLGLLNSFIASAQAPAALRQSAVPHMADGKPDLQGIWQAATTAGADLQDHVAGLNMLAGRSVVADKEIPYQPWAAKQRAENFKNRQTADPFNKCFLPGVPRIMYIDFPFQIFQTPKAITMAFEWELDYRLIHMDGKHPEAADTFWMGDSRGHWDGDTLVVDVGNINDQTWLDKAGDFHSDALHVVERYHMIDHDTIQYEATLEDSKVLTKPFTIKFDLHRRADRDRLFEYVCEAEKQESNGEFTREDKTWYPGSPTAPAMTFEKAAPTPSPFPKPKPTTRRMPDGKPDFNGFYESQSRGANQGLERRAGGGGRGPGGGPGRAGVAAAPRSLIVDPEDGKLPMQPWAVAERVSRNLPERGYDDPTAHCFPPGVPRSLWIPEGFQITQTSDYLVMLFERTSWRVIPLKQTAHIPDNMRLWQGDSIAHWEGDTLVVDTANFNGKTWLNEGGEIVSHALHVVERFTPDGPDSINYQATVTDPVVYTQPWTVAFSIRRENFDLREAACLEEEHDLPHLKALKDAAAAKKK
jgi:hypothetical protein